jgi:hypothetical protein
VVEAPGGNREFRNEVKSPDGEGPCDQNRLELLRGNVLLLGKELTPLTGLGQSTQHLWP